VFVNVLPLKYIDYSSICNAYFDWRLQQMKVAAILKFSLLCKTCAGRVIKFLYCRKLMPYSVYLC
jgi:hypothetical protein